MPSVKVDSSRSPIPLWRTIRDEPPFAVVLPFGMLDQDDHRRNQEVNDDCDQPEGAFDYNRSTAFAGPATVRGIEHYGLETATKLTEIPGPRSPTDSEMTLDREVSEKDQPFSRESVSRAVLESPRVVNTRSDPGVNAAFVVHKRVPTTGSEGESPKENDDIEDESAQKHVSFQGTIDHLIKEKAL